MVHPCPDKGEAVRRPGPMGAGIGSFRRLRIAEPGSVREDDRRGEPLRIARAHAAGRAVDAAVSGGGGPGDPRSRRAEALPSVRRTRDLRHVVPDGSHVPAVRSALREGDGRVPRRHDAELPGIGRRVVGGARDLVGGDGSRRAGRRDARARAPCSWSSFHCGSIRGPRGSGLRSNTSCFEPIRTTGRRSTGIRGRRSSSKRSRAALETARAGRPPREPARAPRQAPATATGPPPPRSP